MTLHDICLILFVEDELFCTFDGKTVTDISGKKLYIINLKNEDKKVKNQGYIENRLASLDKQTSKGMNMSKAISLQGNSEIENLVPEIPITRQRFVSERQGGLISNGYASGSLNPQSSHLYLNRLDLVFAFASPQTIEVNLMNKDNELDILDHRTEFRVIDETLRGLIIDFQYK